MQLAGRFRMARRKDHAVPRELPRPVSLRGCPLDVRFWRRSGEIQPILLASASRRQGNAVARNRFRRRARMAFLAVLREIDCPSMPCIVWVRPGRGSQTGCNIPYSVIEGQLRLALRHWDSP